MGGSAGPEDSVTFALLLRQKRGDVRLTQAALAERAGVSTRGIQHLEAGLGQPHLETTQRLADALGLAGEERTNFEAAARPAPREHQGRVQPLVLTGSSSRHNLPVSVTSFVGRAREVAEVRERLQASRLLTLVGAGGSGKTRLALETARTVVERYPHGVWLVELASLTDSTLVLHQLASVLGVREGPRQPLRSTLQSFLKERHLLLVLDNCEHVIEACVNLADFLLRTCPELRILATSREPLRVAGENTWRVPSLSLPDSQRPISLEQMAESEAVQLFVERAQSVLPCFALDDPNVAAIVRLCRKLDGIPLAVELAAAWVPVLSVEQITERLEDALGLLTMDARLVPVRQQTLRATLDWSYRLLSESEQRLFERLSVFAGGWTLEAVEAICADHRIRHAQVLELLASLVSKSLVLSERHQAGPVRHRLLETVRQYAGEKLAEGDDAGSVCDSHAEFFIELAERLQPGLLGHGARAVLDRLELEQDNLRAALRRLVEHKEAEPAQRLAGALYRFWLLRCYFGEGEEWLRRALALSSTEPRTAERATCLYALGNMQSGRGETHDAEEANREALAIWLELGNVAEQGWTLFALGQDALSRATTQRPVHC